MASLSVTSCMRTTRALSGLTTGLRALSLQPTTTLRSTQTRPCSSTIPGASRPHPFAPVVRPKTPTVTEKGIVGQQARGMKVLSAIKKRCEHCKVRRGNDGETCARNSLADWSWAHRSYGGRRERGTMATDMSFALRIRDTSSDRAPKERWLRIRSCRGTDQGDATRGCSAVENKCKTVTNTVARRSRSMRGLHSTFTMDDAAIRSALYIHDQTNSGLGPFKAIPCDSHKPSIYLSMLSHCVLPVERR